MGVGVGVVGESGLGAGSAVTGLGRTGGGGKVQGASMRSADDPGARLL